MSTESIGKIARSSSGSAKLLLSTPSKRASSTPVNVLIDGFAVPEVSPRLNKFFCHANGSLMYFQAEIDPPTLHVVQSTVSFHVLCNKVHVTISTGLHGDA